MTVFSFKSQSERQMNILFFLALRTCCKWRLFWFCHNVFPWQSNLHEDTIFWWHKGMELSQCLLKVLLKWFTKVGEILNFFQQLSAASSFILHAYWLFGAFPSNLCFFSKSSFATGLCVIDVNLLLYSFILFLSLLGLNPALWYSQWRNIPWKIKVELRSDQSGS